MNRRQLLGTTAVAALAGRTSAAPPRRPDLLFILARVTNDGDDVLWKPGGGAPAPG